MAKKKQNKKTPEQQALERKVKRIRTNAKRLVNRATKRGYSFPENVVPDLPKKITEGTLRRFEKLTPDYLYSKAVYVSKEGTQLTGLQRRSVERSESSQKAAETRQRYYDARQREREAEKWLDYQLENDYNELWYDEPTESEQGYGTAPTPEDETVLRQLEDMIDSWSPSAEWTHISTLSGPLSDYKERDKNLLKSALLSALFTEGRSEVAKRAQQNADQLMHIANRVLYESGSSYKARGVEGVNRDIQLFQTLLTGRSPTVQESLELSDEAERLSFPYKE